MRIRAFSLLLAWLVPTVNHGAGEELVGSIILLLTDRAPAIALAVGQNHSCVVLDDGAVACWGYNLWGQLGDGTDDASAYPVNVAGISTAVDAGTGVRHSCAVLSSGALRCWGDNDFGQLGNNTSGSSAGSFVPVSVDVIGAGAAVSAGDDFTCAESSGSAAWCWGRGSDGQLANGATGSGANRDQPELIEDPEEYFPSSISAGRVHACMVDDSTLSPRGLCWGNNTSGQLGTGDNDPNALPQTVIDSDEVGNLPGVDQIDTGDDHTCAVTTSDTVYCWGFNGSGQLAQNPGSLSSRNYPVLVSGVAGAKAVSAGADHSCAVTNGGAVWCWGNDTYGQLGRGGSATADYIPVQVSGISTAVAVGAGEFHSCALLADASVRCWGRNHHLQLGVTGIASSNVPVEVSGLVVKAD